MSNLQEIPLPSGATLARRSGRALCVADKENYNMIDLEYSSFIAMSPLSQAPDSSVIVKPSITVINESEFLIASWTGASTIGIFVNGDGDPVRGTLEWPAHPQAICTYNKQLRYSHNALMMSQQVLIIHTSLLYFRTKLLRSIALKHNRSSKLYPRLRHPHQPLPLDVDNWQID